MNNETQHYHKVILLPAPVDIFGSCQKFKPESPLNRNTGGRKGHGSIHRNGKEEACLHYIRYNFMIVALDLDFEWNEIDNIIIW